MSGSVLVGDVAGRQSILLIGLLALSGGIVLMFRHRRHLQIMLRESRDPKVRLFEVRKFRRRATTSAMIASIGVMIASLYWATDGRVFTSLIFMILILLVGVFGMALLDIMSIGVQHIAYGERTDDDALIKQYAEWRKKQVADAEKSEDAPPPPEEN
ncbi:MAG: hypothetical protein AAF456_23380 [Planctomycetota bacterium]